MPLLSLPGQARRKDAPISSARPLPALSTAGTQPRALPSSYMPAVYFLWRKRPGVAPRRAAIVAFFIWPIGFLLQSAYMEVVGCHATYSLPFLPCQTAPEGPTIPALPGNGRPPSAQMISDSRKAQRNSFAHHRATLLFSSRTATLNGPDTTRLGFEPKAAEALQSLKAKVREGLHGFAPVVAAPL